MRFVRERYTSAMCFKDEHIYNIKAFGFVLGSGESPEKAWEDAAKQIRGA